MIKEAIGKLVLKKDLTEKEMEEVMEEIVTKKASTPEIASFLTALRMKGETSEEITSSAKVLKKGALKMNLGGDSVCLDREEITVERETILTTSKGFSGGTTIFNVSTATALVVAGGGQKVAKYVRKSFHPLCGCADVIEALGINLDMTSTQIERCFQRLGICFLHEPLVHNSLGNIISIRKRIGIRTLFNLLDPLINPGGAKIQVLGVYDPNLTEKMARVLMNLGIEKGLVIHGKDTLDEISITGETKVTEFKREELRTYFIKPEDFGLRRADLKNISGGTKEQNAEIILEVLKGASGPKRDIVVLNAGAVFMISGKAKDFHDGIQMAKYSIDSGKAFETLQRVIQFTNTEKRFLRSRDFSSAEIS
ncbi:MAG: anthranilate phosphoribosyltransferase [Thermodesulfobacteriota bacterium]